MKIGFIGAGKVGTTFGKYLKNHGIEISGYYSKSFSSSKKASNYTNSKAFGDIKEFTDETQVIFITTSDDSIKEVGDFLVEEKLINKSNILIHMSGAHSTELFSKAKEIGIKAFSIHPLQAFANEDEALIQLKNTYFSIEGDLEDRMIINYIFDRIKNPYFEIETDKKSIYHSSACVFSNYLVTLMDLGLELFSAAGIDKEVGFKSVEPLIVSTIENIKKLGPEKAITGPISRGDIKTIEGHIEKIKINSKDNLKAYRFLGLETLKLSKKYKLKDSKKINDIKKLFEEV